MADLAERLFRYFGKAELTRKDGTSASGRGTAVRMRETAGEYTGWLPHGTGNFERPLYVFTGSLTGVGPGDVITADGASFTVLRAEEIRLKEKRLCLRAVMEKREEETDDGA